MAQSPQLKIYTQAHGYIGCVKHGEDAACLAALNGEGTKIKFGHKTVVWHEGHEEFEASESYDRVALTINQRIDEMHRKSFEAIYGNKP